MSDIALPGIDTAAPPAGDNPAAPPASADTPVTPGTNVVADDAPLDNADGASAGASRDDPANPDDPPPQKPNRPRGRNDSQRRIDELTAQNRAYERIVEAAIGNRLPQQTPAAQPDAAQGDPEPQEKEFGDWNAYQRALARWEGRQETRRVLSADRQQAERAYGERQQAQAVEQTRAAVGQMQRSLGQAMLDTAAKYPDFHDVIESSTFDHPVPLQAVIASSDAPGDVAYYLAKNEDVARQLAVLPPIKAAHYVARIALAMTKSSRVVSSAPEPGRPSGTRGASVNAYPDNATPEQHLAWEQRQKAARGATR